MRGRRIDGSMAGLVDKEKRAGASAVGLREGEIKPVSHVYPPPLPPSDSEPDR